MHLRTDLRLENVTLSAGSSVVLKDVSLQTSLAGITLLSGRNGTAKTTLLRALLGLDKPSHGNIFLRNAVPEDIRRDVGYMPQSIGDAALAIPAFSHVLSAVGGACWGLPFRWRARRREAERVLELTGARVFAHRPLGALSGGERQRIGLAQALVGAPELLFLDEPLAGLDHDAQNEIISLLCELSRNLGIGVLMTSHETSSLKDVVSRTLLLEGGHLRARI
ncbi:ATP-binding cassette domain-containing protein [Gluconobacter wancherniae]|uniref:ATP-binding cassette domain-containing protein n=1 Tax=Gluconobacter wancherniae TaxID=1307955 RepID=UPI0030B575DC